MKISKTLIRLSYLVVLLTVIATLVGLFLPGGKGPFTFTTLHGKTVDMYGSGLYQNDTVLGAVGYKIGDASTLILAIPLLLFSLWRYRRGSLRGGILLTGVFMYLLYYYGSMALGAAYNNLFLIYIVLTSSTFFGLLIAVASFDQFSLPARFSKSLPVRGISIFLIISGLALFCIWLFLSILPALFAGSVPDEVASNTTVITFVVDMGLIAPSMVIVGTMLSRRAPMGYVLASIFLVFIDVLGLALLAMGIRQEVAGLMKIGQFIGFVVSFAILTLFSLGFTASLFRNISD